MFNQTYYLNLVKNAEKIVDHIKILESKGFKKNRDRIALLNLTLYLLIKEIKSEMNF